VAAAECLRNVLAAEVLGNPHKDGGLGTVFGKGRPAKLMVDAGLMPAVAGMLRVSRSDAAWCACVGLLNNVCLISQVRESSGNPRFRLQGPPAAVLVLRSLVQGKSASYGRQLSVGYTLS
jgi:hypothetical protein